ncbi:MAG: aldose 1-epimerase [Burkholderiaceae bacterium]
MNPGTRAIVQLRMGGARAQLLPQCGGRVATLQLAGPDGEPVDVLYPYPLDVPFDPVRWARGGIYPLMPYSNRVANARVCVDGVEIALKPHPDSLPHALHGNAHRLPWRLDQQDDSSALLRLDAPPSADWPWHYSGRLDIALSAHALAMRIEIRNAGERAMPAGIGLHPYFQHLPQAKIGYHADAVWPPNAEFLATTPRVPSTHESYRPARPLPPGGLTNYAGGWDGRAEVELPQGAWLRVEADPLFCHLVVHRPDNLAYMCLEPVSHVADGFNLAARGVADTGTHWLAPGESLAGTMRFSVSSTSRDDA